MKRTITAVALGLALVGCDEGTTAPEPDRASSASQASASAAVRDRYVVVLRPGGPGGAAVEAEARQIAAQAGGRVQHVYTHALQGFSLEVPAQALEGIRRNPRVAHVEPDVRMQAAAQVLPTGIDHAGADQNAAARIDGVDDLLDVDIAILDSGIDFDHPDLRVTQFYNCIDTTNDDLYGHGTHVAGIAAARDNGQGVVGMAPGARLWAVKVLDNYGNGSLASVLCGVDYVAANAAEIEVANMSLGGSLWSDALQTSVRSAVDAGVFLSAAAGNARGNVYGSDATFGTTDDYLPAALPEVAAVSALADSDGQSGGSGSGFALCQQTQLDDAFACFSNYSPSVVSWNPVQSAGAAIDLAAPGVAILSTYPGGGTSTMDGTSMAAPHVAGAAALRILAQGTRDGNGDGVLSAADVYQLRQALIDGALAQAGWRSDGLTADRDAQLEGALQVGSSTSEPAPAPSPVYAAPAVTPDNATATATEQTTGHRVVFSVANQSSESESLSLACATSGAVASCSTPASVTVAAGGSAQLEVSYSTGAAGSGSLSLTATGQGGSDNGTFHVTVEAEATTVDPALVLHVQWIDLSTTFKAQSTEPQGIAAIYDLNDQPVGGAAVTGDWYLNGGLIESGASGDTNGKGEARIRGPRVKANSGDVFQLCVTHVRLSGYTYDATQNHESCDQLTASSR